MDSLAEQARGSTPKQSSGCCYQEFKFIFSANVRSAVRVFTGEAGVTFALL